MSDESCTVLIPTRQRPRHLERLLRFLADGGLRSRVLIADSSSDAGAATREVAARASSYFECTYQAYSPDTPLFQKCFQALQLVRTPLVTLLADDDFIVPSTLASAAERLTADPSIAVAHGTAMCISLETGSASNPMSTMRSRSRRHLVAEQESGVERVAHYLRNYASIYYSVARRSHLETNFRHLSELNLDYDFGQILSGCLCLANGKAVAVSGLYYVVMDTAVAASRTQSALIPGWRRLLTDPEYSRKYSLFKELVLADLTRTSTRDEAERELDSAFVDYVVQRVVNGRVGELERIVRVSREAGESVRRLGAIVSRGVRGIAEHPRSIVELAEPRKAMSRWARAIDPMSFESLRKGADADAISQVLASLDRYAG